MADDWGGGSGGGGGGGGGGYDDDDGGGSVGETSHKSWFQRVMDSFVGAVVGIVLFLLSFVILFWNEGRAVERTLVLTVLSANVKEIKSDAVDNTMEGKPVHMTGKAVPTDPVKDDVFGIEANAIRLARTVEMFQWIEKSKSEKKKAAIGGKETTKTTYSYEKTWSPSPVDSSNFKWNRNLGGGAADPDDEFGDNEPGGKKPRVNPPWPDQYKSANFYAKQVKLGAYTLSDPLVKRISGNAPLPVNQDEFDKFPGDLRNQFVLDGSGLYMAAKGGGPKPALGDLRVNFNVVNATDVSVIAQQSGTTFTAYQATKNSSFESLVGGIQTSKKMIEDEHAANTMITWILRLVGFLCMAIGFYMVLKPIAILTDFLPFISSLVGFVLGFIAVLVAVPFTLITIAIAWIFYRPMFGLALLGIAAVILGVVIFLYLKAKKNKPASSNNKSKSKSRDDDDEEEERPRKRRPADDEDDDRPRRRRD